MKNEKAKTQNGLSEKKNLNRKALSLLILFGFSIGIGVYAYRSLFVGHFGTVVEGRLYRSRQPVGVQYTVLLQLHGFTRIINLRNDDEAPECFAEEQQFCRENGIDFVNIPIKTRVPSHAQVEEFIRLVDSSPGPVLVHCAEGRNRTGMMSAAYRVAKQDLSIDQAFQEELLDYNAHPEGEKIREIVQLLEYCSKKGSWGKLAQADDFNKR